MASGIFHGLAYVVAVEVADLCTIGGGVAFWSAMLSGEANEVASVLFGVGYVHIQLAPFCNTVALELLAVRVVCSQFSLLVVYVH